MIRQEPFLGRSPRRMSKGLRRHLAVVKRQNPMEAERQTSMVDTSLPPYKSEKKQGHKLLNFKGRKIKR